MASPSALLQPRDADGGAELRVTWTLLDTSTAAPPICAAMADAGAGDWRKINDVDRLAKASIGTSPQ